MTPELSAAAPRYERLVWWGGLAALVAVLCLGLVATTAFALMAPETAWLLPLLLLALPALALVPKTKATPLVGILVLFGSIRNEAGLQPAEVLFALALVGYLGWWFGTRALVLRDRVIRTAADGMVVTFVVYATASLGLTLLFGGDLTSAISEWINFVILGLLFPMREVFEETPRRVWWIVAMVFFFGAVASFRVVSTIISSLSNVEYAWEVARGRATMNETWLYGGSLLALCLAASMRRWKHTLVLSVPFALFTMALIMTQWRSYYLAWAIAFAVVLVLGRGGVRVRSVWLVAAGGLVGAAAAYFIFGDRLMLAVFGILDRILSIGTASSQDISLMNRNLESAALWKRILESPLLGHGPGVSFSFYDAIFRGTWTKTFAHSTYLMVWFKYGLFGLLLFLSVWAAALWTGIRVAWTAARPTTRALGLYVAVSLTGLAASSLVSAALSTDDTVLCFAMLFAVAATLRTRAWEETAPDAPPAVA